MYSFVNAGAAQMSSSIGPSPGAIRHPGHQISIGKDAGHWIASLNGGPIADSHETLTVDETRFGRTIYFPPQDVMSERLKKSDSSTVCPFKGGASYFSAAIDGEIRDVAWYYPAVYEEVAELAGYVAFYTDHVDVTRIHDNG